MKKTSITAKQSAAIDTGCTRRTSAASQRKGRNVAKPKTPIEIRVRTPDSPDFTIRREFRFQMDQSNGGVSGAVLIFARGDDHRKVFARHLGRWSVTHGLTFEGRPLDEEDGLANHGWGLLPHEEKALAEAASEFASWSRKDVVVT